MILGNTEPRPAGLIGGASDPARRLADMWNLHASTGLANGKWFAVRLQDGTTPDGNQLYETRDDAISRQLHPEYCGYLQVQPYPMAPTDAEDFLTFYRIVFDAGHRQIDETVPSAIMPLEFSRNAPATRTRI